MIYSSRASRCSTTMARGARTVFQSWLPSLQKEPLDGKISGDEKASGTDPHRHGPFFYRYVPTVDEPQRVEKGDQCEEEACHENKDALFHRRCLRRARVPSRLGTQHVHGFLSLRSS